MNLERIQLPESGFKLLGFLPVLLLVCLVFAGCGGDSKSDDEGTPGENTVAKEQPAAESVKLTSFTSPEGNIGCIADRKLVRCDISKPDWKIKPNPKCNLDWGNGLSVASGKGEIVCAGDTTLNNGPALKQKEANLIGPFLCHSNETGDGITCINRKTTHGFELSAADYRVF